MSEEQPGEPSSRPGTKAGRNARRTLLATFLNNLGVAYMLAGLLQPVLTAVAGTRPLRALDMVVSLGLVALGAILHFVAQRVAARLED